MTRKETLHNAEICVCGQREEEYGSPENNFALIGNFWTEYINTKCRKPDGTICVEAEDVGPIMTLLKIARIASGQTKPDNYIDGCGYLACAAEIATKPSEELPSIMQITADNLAKNFCAKHDHDCHSCPIGIENNGKGVSCSAFRVKHPDEAIQIMRKVGE